jgi:hypothetical protein
MGVLRKKEEVQGKREGGQEQRKEALQEKRGLQRTREKDPHRRWALWPPHKILQYGARYLQVH